MFTILINKNTLYLLQLKLIIVKNAARDPRPASHYSYACKTDRPTDRQTDRHTLQRINLKSSSLIECSKTKIKKAVISIIGIRRFVGQQTTTGNKIADDRFTSYLHASLIYLLIFVVYRTVPSRALEREQLLAG